MPGTVTHEQLIEIMASRGAQLAEVLPKDEYDEEHLRERCTYRWNRSHRRAQATCSTRAGR